MGRLLIVCGLGLGLLAAACGKGGDSKGGGGMDEADQFMLKGIKEDTQAVKDALAKGEDPKYTCAGTGTYAEKLKDKKNADVEAAVKTFTQLCSYDVPMAALEKAVKAAEEARKAKPTEEVLSECYSADQSTATEELQKGFATDEKFKALTARWDAACPAKK